MSGSTPGQKPVGQPSQRVQATVTFGPQDSEMVGVRQLLAKIEFTAQLLVLDSLHTPQA